MSQVTCYFAAVNCRELLFFVLVTEIFQYCYNSIKEQRPERQNFPGYMIQSLVCAKVFLVALVIFWSGINCCAELRIVKEEL